MSDKKLVASDTESKVIDNQSSSSSSGNENETEKQLYCTNPYCNSNNPEKIGESKCQKIHLSILGPYFKFIRQVLQNDRNGRICDFGIMCKNKDTSCPYKHISSHKFGPCKYGSACLRKETCKFIHTETSETPTMKSTKKCKYGKDKCQFGDDCRFIHD